MLENCSDREKAKNAFDNTKRLFLASGPPRKATDLRADRRAERRAEAANPESLAGINTNTMRMKRLTLTTITLLAMSCFARAERINIGDYFTINIPRSWEVTTNGQHVHAPDDYVVYRAQGIAGITISVVNLPAEQTGTIDYKVYSSWTEAELPTVAQFNHKTGWTLPIVKKIEVNTIPILLFKQQPNVNGFVVYMLELQLYIAEKHFEVTFSYTKESIQTVNNIIDSMKRGVPPPALPLPAPVPAGIAGEET
jgi:hypothetical protein